MLVGVGSSFQVRPEDPNFFGRRVVEGKAESSPAIGTSHHWYSVLFVVFWLEFRYP